MERAPLHSEEAFRIGFVDRLVPDEQLLDEVTRVRRRPRRQRVASIDGRDEAADLRRLGIADCADALFGADVHVQAALVHPDATEGVASFVERRPPGFAPLSDDAD